MLRLEYTLGGEHCSILLRGGELRLGRGTDNEVVLPDASVSRRHAKLTPGTDGWHIVDLGSTNGVRVNERRVRSRRLCGGDRLRVGNVEMSLVDGGEPDPGARHDEVTAAGQEAAAPVQPLTDTPATAPPLGPKLPPGATVVRPLADFAASYGLSGEHPLVTERKRSGGQVGVGETGESAESAGAAEQDPATAKRQLLEQAYGNRIFGYLTRLAGLLLTANSVDEVLERVIGICFEALPVERGFILLLDEAGEPVCELARQGSTVRYRPRGEVPVSRTMLAEVMRDRVALITLDAQADRRLRQGDSVRLHQIRAAMCVPLWFGDRISGVMQVDTPYRANVFTERDLDFFTALANYAAVAVERQRYAETVERERRFRERLERYHSPRVIEAVMQRDGVVGDMERLQPAEATVLFADLVGFTAVAETLEPQAVANLLAGFFTISVEAIFALGGTLDKFIGDCVMAFFGAPVAQGDHAQRAVQGAIDIQRGLGEWNRQHRGALPPLMARIGINTGPVVVGEVGTSRRVDYTVLGNTVNVAARLEAHVAGAGDIVLGSETQRLVGESIATESMGDFQLRGLSQRVAAFRVARTW